MATKKQQREAAALKRAEFLENERQRGAKALELARQKREKQKKAEEFEKQRRANKTKQSEAFARLAEAIVKDGTLLKGQPFDGDTEVRV